MQVTQARPSGTSARPGSDHFDGKHFFNPTLPNRDLPSFANVFKMIAEGRSRWPRRVENTAIPRVHEPVAAGRVALTFVNHATFLIQFHGLNILTDPMWSDRASPVGFAGPKRVRKPGIAFADLPRIDLVLISHNHYDHLDVRTLALLNENFAPRVIAPLGTRELIASTGIKEIHELDWWETIEIDGGLNVTFTPTQHFSARGMFDRQKALWGSYMVEEQKRIYFGADSGYSRHFAEIRDRLGSPDLAMLGMGAYEPRWFMRSMHMNPAEAVRAHMDLGSRHSIGMHFGTFQLSAEGIDQPKEDLRAALAEEGIPESEFVTQPEGETTVY